MKQMYAEERIITIPLFVPRTETAGETKGEIVRREIEDTREIIVAQMKQDGADPRHYAWTVHKLMTFCAGYIYVVTAERHPDDVIERINEQIAIDLKGAGSNAEA